MWCGKGAAQIVDCTDDAAQHKRSPIQPRWCRHDVGAHGGVGAAAGVSGKGGCQQRRRRRRGALRQRAAAPAAARGQRLRASAGRLAARRAALTRCPGTAQPGASKPPYTACVTCWLLQSSTASESNRFRMPQRMRRAKETIDEELHLAWRQQGRRELLRVRNKAEVTSLCDRARPATPARRRHNLSQNPT